MRRLVYSVAASLDGFIAGPQGEYDWIVQDPSFDFAALWERFDTLLMGRRTYEVALTRLNSLHSMGKKIVVVSTTLDPAKHPEATVLAKNVPDAVARLKAEPGKDIWLMGGGALFRGLLDAGLVDSIEVALSPVLLGGGVPLIPAGRRHTLQSVESKVLPSGIVRLRYRIFLSESAS
jgi:dihydrofolate reductase